MALIAATFSAPRGVFLSRRDVHHDVLSDEAERTAAAAERARGVAEQLDR